MNSAYIITFYAVVALLVLDSFAAGYLYARRMFPHSKSPNRENANK